MKPIVLNQDSSYINLGSLQVETEFLEQNSVESRCNEYGETVNSHEKAEEQGTIVDYGVDEARNSTNQRIPVYLKWFCLQILWHILS